MNSLMSKPKLAAAGVAVAMAATPAAALASAAAAPSLANWQIPLHASTAFPKANGSAQYQSQPGQRELQVEVQHARSLAGKSVIFSAAGTRLGSAKISARGQADITRNTERRQRVPLIVHGSGVTVSTATGKLIVSGRF
jgi:hypothetical protein